MIGLRLHPRFFRKEKEGIFPTGDLEDILYQLYGFEQGKDFHISQTSRLDDEYLILVLPKRQALHFCLAWHDLIERIR